MSATKSTGIREASLLPVLQRAGYASYQVKEEFFSKRNNVFLLKVERMPQEKLADSEAVHEIDILASMGLFETGHDCGHDCGSCHEECAESCAEKQPEEELVVWKQYELGDTMYELAMLKLLNNNKLKVPTVLAASDDGILLQYIEGTNLCHLFAEAEKNGDYAEDIVLMLAGWFKKYYRATGGKSRGDINLRNFIYNEHDGVLYGIDFENTVFRSAAYDIGDLLAYMVNYEPAFTEWKCEWVRRAAVAFIMELGLRTDDVRAEYRAALDDLEKRRSVKVPAEIFDILDEI